jgi:hypothetical protein
MSSLSKRGVEVDFDPSFSIDLGKTEWLQFTYELPGNGEEFFPPRLHPTTPVVVTLRTLRHSVIGASADVSISLPAVRFVQDPTLLAVGGTGKLDST